MPGYDSWASFTKKFSSMQKWETQKGLTKTGDSSSPTRWINNHSEPNDDFAAPYLENQSPAPGALADKFATVSFDIVDDGNGIPLSGITINLEGVTAFNGTSFVAPYNGALSKYVKQESGKRWSFVIDKTAAWSGTVDVVVQVIATDYWSNTLNTSYSFEGDLGAPWITGEEPEPNGYILNDGLIWFDVMDDNALVDPATVDAYVDSAWALKSDGDNWIFKAPYNGANSDAYAIQIGDDYGYHIVLDRTTSYTGDFEVEVYADDYRGNTLNTSWNINTYNGPFLRDHNPVDDSLNNDPNTNITFNVLDETAVLQNTIDAYVEGTWAYDGANDIFKYPYNDSGSSITPISTGDGYDGYTIVIDSYNTYDSHVNVQVLAEDGVGNSLDDDTYDFFCDIVAPSLINKSPADGATGQPVTTVVSVGIRDYGSGVDPTTIDAYVNGAWAYDGATNTFKAPFNGAGSTLTTVADGYNLFIDHATDWAYNQTYGIRVDATDYVGNGSTGSWSWSTDEINITFQLDFESGVDNLPVAYDFNGDSENPTFVYNGVDATRSQWPPYSGYGSTLLVNGSTPWMAILHGSPLNGINDDSVKYNSGKRHYASSAATGDVGAEDMVVELIVKTGEDGNIVSKGSAAGGWVIQQISNVVSFSVYGATGSRSVSTDTLEPYCWYYIKFIYDVTGYLYSLVNGKLQNTTLASGAVGTLTNVSRLIIGENWDGNVSRLSMWKKVAWVAGTDNEIALYHRERFMKATGTFPTYAEGSTVPYGNDRLSPAYLKKTEAGNDRLYLVGEHWMRVETMRDTSNIEHSGVRIEDRMTNDWNSGWWTPHYSYDYPSSINGPAKDLDGVLRLTEEQAPDNRWHGIATRTRNQGSPFITSVFAKAGYRTVFSLAVRCVSGFCSTHRCWFDLSTGTVGTKTAGVLDSGIEPFIDGWYRCWIRTEDWTSQSALMFIELSPADGVWEYIGTNVSNALYIFGIQHESSAVNKFPQSLFKHSYAAGKVRYADTLRFQGGDNVGNGDENYIECDVIFDDVDLTQNHNFVSLIDTGSLTVELYALATNDRAHSKAASAPVAAGPNTDIADGDLHELVTEYWSGHLRTVVDDINGTLGGLGYVPSDIVAINIGRDTTAIHYANGLIARVKIWNFVT